MAEEKAIVEQPNSCKIAVNAKGQWSGEVKVYAETSLKAFDEAVKRATELASTIGNRNQ